MTSSTVSYPAPTAGPERPAPALRLAQLLAHYEEVAEGNDLEWLTRHRDLRMIGSGGQGVVFLARREGADGFSLPVALKVFSPESYHSPAAYADDMARVAAVAARAALIQHDNLLYVHDFTEQAGVRVMVMEWVDGRDLRSLLSHDTWKRSELVLSPEHWSYVRDVIWAEGPAQPRFKPGVAVQVLRDGLAALAAMHRHGLVHGDLKPANVMLKRTGVAKVIDIGSTVDVRSAAGRRAWSPAYAAPEVLAGGDTTPQSDLASLGYVFVEMLAGRSPFEGVATLEELLVAKKTLEARLPDLLPAEVLSNELLLSIARKLVSADPRKRYSDAQTALTGRRGAAAFHRQLVKGDLASEYQNDLRVWMEGIG